MPRAKTPRSGPAPGPGPAPAAGGARDGSDAPAPDAASEPGSGSASAPLPASGSAPLPHSASDEVRRRLLDFYDAHGRDLPWRENRDGYRVWVSEIMLQQTRVEAVIPYYEGWMQRFPTLDALADAPSDDVLKAWEGLGYYSRARNLHSAARIVRERYNGALPGEYAELRALPGVGDYTAGAIASIVHHRPEPAVDGNVRRVLSRFYDRDLDGKPLRAAAAALVPEDRPGDFNQALMELGATICSSRAPRCHDCPVNDLCAAHAHGTQLERPSRKRKSDVPEFDVGVAVIRDAHGRFLLVRRPDRGLLAGMWELPGRIVEADEDPADAAVRAARAVLQDGNVALASDDAVAHVRHVFSHRVERYHAYELSGRHQLRRTTGGAWQDAEHVLPRAQQKLLRLIGGPVA